MQRINFSTGRTTDKWFIILFVLIAGVFLQTNAQAFDLNVVDQNGSPVGVAYRWLVEEDVTYAVDPANPAADEDTLALNFHKSYMPVVAEGESISNPATINLPSDKRYFVSVLPFPGGYTMGGAPVAVGQTDVTITLNPHPVPTAQISVFVFEDNEPINNAPDLPSEQGIAGFDIKVFDAGGRYGIVGGQQFTDVFGNPLGTTYNPDGSVLLLGGGTILTDADGFARVQNLAPGKYGIVVTPPAGQGWQQTSTIEGSPTIDAWVKANEPPFFTEFGPPGQHVFVGFVREMNDPTVLTGGATISGKVVNLHLSRPPDATFHNGNPFPDSWVGLNDLSVGTGRGVYAAPANADSTFSIENVPPGTYELVTWDTYLNQIISLRQVIVADPAPATIALGDVPAFSWFGRLQGSVFYDEDADGFRDDGEFGLPDQAVLLRFRDGTVYDATATDSTGAYSFPKIFPFFSWLVTEVDFLRFTATGATVVVDGGGAIQPDAGWAMPSFDRLNPQVQNQDNPETFNNLSWTEASVPGEDLLTLGIQTFLGQTNVIDWGKRDYDPNSDPFPNGGISGIVFYDTTRAENEPDFNFGEEWQPGIPRIQVNLYEDTDADGVIDDTNGTAGIQLADVDNHPLGWSDGSGARGPEDIDQDDPVFNAGIDETSGFSMGDAIQIAHTDSWDDELPTDCPGDPADPFYNNGKCYDGLRNYNQVRPALFDGGYAFAGLVSGTYIVEVGQHTVYDVGRTQDKNVDFGDEYTPSGLLLPPPCVGEPYDVPVELSLFPDVTHPFYDPESAAYRPGSDPFTNPVVLNHCDQKQVEVVAGANAAAEFFLFTATPPSARIKGFILNDLANEFDPANPNFGEKFAPPLLPVSFRDWTGKEITRVYSDQFGNYNLLVPSTYTANVPNPSGFSPAMLIGCMNDPGPIEDENGQMIIDPAFRQEYSQFCYTFQYMPGAITYLDTPVLSIAAFAGQDVFPVDCEYPDGTPIIHSATQQGGNGPYIPMTTGSQTLQITALGDTSVPNPATDGTAGTLTVTRDFGFGNSQGTVTIGDIELDIVSWSNGVIAADVPDGTAAGNYQLMVTRGDNDQTTEMGVTVVVGPFAGSVLQVSPSVNPGATPIQDAIDLAQPGDLILVGTGAYEELVILYKDVQLQGAGAHSTTINAVQAPGEKLLAWRQKVEDLITGDFVDLLPFQEPGFGGFEPDALFTEEGAGILVMASDPDGPGPNVFGPGPRPRIDGFTVTGSPRGGGIVLNGYARYLDISNNRVTGNAGVFGGGIRSGHPFINNVEIVDAVNDNLIVHHNQVTRNGSTGAGAGGGISLYTGTDNYQVTDNYICGNLTVGEGGGIGHLGLSDNSLIGNNKVLFNQSFNQGISVSGGGIFIGGAQPEGGALTAGSGSVVVDSNIIQGNQAGAGDGGGIRLAFVNGQDIQEFDASPENWHSVDIVNNMIVNNQAGLAAGGISMQDAARPNIINNTIANNDSTATAGLAFESVGGQPPDASTPQPAGVVSRAHSTALATLVDGLVTGGASGPFYQGFSNPQLVNNIIWENRSFNFQIDFTTNTGVIAPIAAPWNFNDLAVLPPGTGALDPLYCLLTDPSGFDTSNITGDPGFVSDYFNGPLGNILGMPEGTTAFSVAAALDEGGNFIDVRFSPLTRWNDPTANDGAPGTLFGDYHLSGDPPAVNAGIAMAFTPAALDALLDVDIDDEDRPTGAGVDIGADEFVAAGPDPGDVCPGDVNGDNAVNFDDLTLMRGQFFQTCASLPAGTICADLSGDGSVSFADLEILRANFFNTCP